jgi:hypothetical protein
MHRKKTTGTGIFNYPPESENEKAAHLKKGPVRRASQRCKDRRRNGKMVKIVRRTHGRRTHPTTCTVHKTKIENLIQIKKHHSNNFKLFAYNFDHFAVSSSVFASMRRSSHGSFFEMGGLFVFTFRGIVEDSGSYSFFSVHSWF